jgi:hypothetical protein
VQTEERLLLTFFTFFLGVTRNGGDAVGVVVVVVVKEVVTIVTVATGDTATTVVIAIVVFVVAMVVVFVVTIIGPGRLWTSGSTLGGEGGGGGSGLTTSEVCIFTCGVTGRVSLVVVVVDVVMVGGDVILFRFREFLTHV